MLKGYYTKTSTLTKPIAYNFTNLLKACGDNAALNKGKQVHASIIVTGSSLDLFSMTALINMYAKTKQMDDGYKVFDKMPLRDLACWNTVVSGYAQNGMARKSLEMVLEIWRVGFRPDSVTLVSVLPAVADVGAVRTGTCFHGYVVQSGFGDMVNVATALVYMYGKCGAVGSGRLVFDGMRRRTVVSWNVMIDGYVRNGDPEAGMAMFQMMLDEGVEPSNVSVTGALQACGDLGDVERGKFVHKLLERVRLDTDVSVMNSLISMYSKCKHVDIAAEIFEKLQGNATLVSWNTMILGYSQSGRINEALKCFCEMQSRNVKPDSYTMVSVILALAELSVTRKAKWIHGLATRNFLGNDVHVMTALVDMYAKCGAIHTARRLFDMMDERHVITWNTMIDGYGTHGLGRAAVELFNEMRRGIIKPNDITFLCILSACSHSGLVDEGLLYFSMMEEEYGLQPSMDHYGSMVDLLGRAGRLKQAWEFINSMPVKPAVSVYGAMLGACRIHKNVELGEQTAGRLFELNPVDGGYHALLANIYATASMWDKVAKVRITMERKGIQKAPGCSVIELGNKIHSFYSGSTSHPQSKKIYAFIETLLDKIKAAGYVPDISSIHDVEYDVKEQLLNGHSERLAIAFGLLNTTPGTTLHIRKNLRVCGDCHTATKYISLVTGREIIVRDLKRFHHFKNGSCSCGDYW